MKPKILLFDIETSANLAWVWGKYEQDVIAYEQEWYMLSWSAKWIDGRVINKRLCDYPGYRPGIMPGKTPDKKLVTELWHLFNEADIIIGHNGDKFDIRKTNTRFIENGLTPPAPYKTIDTLKVAKNKFGWNSNKLDDLGNRLGVGRKEHNEGWPMWLGCITGDKAQWDKMGRYNNQDVLLLERIYLKLRPWMPNHPNVAIMADQLNGCPHCGSKNIKAYGHRYTQTGKTQRYQCNDCHAYSSGKHEKVTEIR